MSFRNENQEPLKKNHRFNLISSKYCLAYNKVKRRKTFLSSTITILDINLLILLFHHRSTRGKIPLSHRNTNIVMAFSFMHGIAAGTLVTFITFFALFNASYHFLPSASYSMSNITNRTADIPHIASISYEGYQFFVFADESPLVRAYLDVVRDTVCGLALRTQERAYGFDNQVHPMDIKKRIKGLDWPLTGITMVGQRRLINIEWAIRFVIGNAVVGDFIECGVWRGGSSVFARAVLKALNNTDKHVWLADSFQGLPKARTSNDNDNWSRMEYLKVLI